MVFLLDDLALRTLGVSIPGYDMIWLFEQLRDIAYKELYNPEKIKDQIKENRLLYEFGEITQEEYEKTKAELMHKLKLAERGEEMNLKVRTDILGK